MGVKSSSLEVHSYSARALSLRVPCDVQDVATVMPALLQNELEMH